MPRELAYTPDVVAAAIVEARGMLTVAADRIGCSTTLIYRYRDRYAVVRAAIAESRERMRDFAENKLFDKVADGELQAITYYLSTQAKDRGYVRRDEHSGPDGGPIPVGLSVMDVVRRARLGSPTEGE